MSIRPSTLKALLPTALLPTALLLAALLAGGDFARAEPLFSLGEGGRTFLYRARPGDTPTGVASMFGIPSEQLQEFLKANRIDDATRVGAGFVYRIPNAPLRALEHRAATLETTNAQLAREAGELRTRIRALDRDVGEARAGAVLAESHAERLAWLDSVWPAARAGMVVLALIAAAAGTVAGAAVRRQRQAERYARTLAQEVDEKRKAGMTERQESARRVLDLETRIRTLESQIGPRVLIGGRGN
jgi:hypothetical protein